MRTNFGAWKSCSTILALVGPLRIVIFMHSLWLTLHDNHCLHSICSLTTVCKYVSAMPLHYNQRPDTSSTKIIISCGTTMNTQNDYRPQPQYKHLWYWWKLFKMAGNSASSPLKSISTEIHILNSCRGEVEAVVCILKIAIANWINEYVVSKCLH